MARWFVMGLLVVLLTGCGQQAMISRDSPVEKILGSEKHVVEFWHTYSDEETRLLENVLIPAFEKEHPDIHVKAVRQGNNIELKYALISKASANRAPDVVRMDIAWVPEFAQSGLLVPLNEFEDFERVRETLQSHPDDAGYDQGVYYSLPVNTNTKVAIFNRRLLEQAGLKEPPATLRDVIKLAREHQYLIGMGGLEAWRSLPYIYALGGRMTNDSYTQATGYLNGESTVNAVEELVRLYDEHLIERSVVKGGGDNWEGVKTGNILMTDDGPWFYSVFEVNESELDRALQSTIAVPFAHNEGAASILGGEDLVILKGAQQPKEAWEFMKWMTSSLPQTLMLKTGLIPTNLEAREAKVKEDSYYYPFTEALNHTFLRPPVKRWSAIDEVYTSYMTQIFQKELTVKDGLTQAAQRIDVLLKE